MADRVDRSLKTKANYHGLIYGVFAHAEAWLSGCESGNRDGAETWSRRIGWSSDSQSQRTGTDVSVSVGGDGGGIRTVARDSAQTGAAEHRRAGVSLPVRPIRVVDLSERGCCANGTVIV